VFRGFLSLYIVLIYVLIYSAAQLQECLINLLTYLRTDVNERTTPDGMARFLPVTSMYRLLCIGLNKTKRYLIHTVTHRFMLIHTKLFKNYRKIFVQKRTHTNTLQRANFMKLFVRKFGLQIDIHCEFTEYRPNNL